MTAVFHQWQILEVHLDAINGSDQVGRRALRRLPGSYGPEDRKAAMERREAPGFSRGNAARRKDPVRHSVLHPLDFCEGEGLEDGLPGVAKNTGDGGCLLAVMPRTAHPPRLT